MNENRFYVYGLFHEDDDNNVCFYIGKGTANRKDEHLKEWCLEKEAGSHKTKKIRKLKRNGKEPFSKILVDGLTNEQASKIEEALLCRDEVFDKVVNKSRNSHGGITKEISDEVIDKLGKVPDVELAEVCDVSAKTIKRHRKEKGIEKATKIELPEECICKMGKVSDSKLADQYGVNQTTISKKRKERGITQYDYDPKKTLPEHLVEKLGEVPDGKIAEQCELSGPTVARRRKERDIEPYKWWK